MRYLQKIEIVFENTDSIIISEHLDKCGIGLYDLSKDISYSGLNHSNNFLLEMTIANKVQLLLSEEHNTIHYAFGIEEYKSTVFDRLKLNDTTSIILHLSDNEEEKNKESLYTEQYYVPWEECNNWGIRNKNQKTEINKNRQLIVDISCRKRKD